MIVAQEVGEGAAKVNVKDDPAAGVANEDAASVADDDVNAADVKPSIASPPPTTQSLTPPQEQEQPSRQDCSSFRDHKAKTKGKEVRDKEQAESVQVKKIEEVEVVTTAKLITEVVTADSTTITVAAPTLTTAPSVARRRKGVVIREPEETATTPSIIIHTEPKSMDKGKGIMDEVIEQVQRKEKEDNAIIKYQALKRKPQTKAQARKNMMIYLKNMAGFKMDYFRGMSYDDIHPIFEKKFNSSRMDEEVEELRKHLQIVPNDNDDVYTEATPLALKVPVVDYEIYTEHNKPYYKIKRADSSHQLYLSFLTRCTSSNLEKSKKCSWISEGQKLEADRILWCADYHIYYNIVDFSSREEISTYKKALAALMNLMMLIVFLLLQAIVLRHKVAMLSMKVKRFYKKIGRKLEFNWKEPVDFYKTKVECFNCHIRGHFSRDCRSAKNSGNKSRDARNAGYRGRDNGKRPAKEEMKKHWFKKGEGYHAIPPPLIGNYMPPKYNLSFARLDDSIYMFKISETVTSVTKDEKDAPETSTACVDKPKEESFSAPLIQD
uniref:Ribonuclease H-like domain-containing protein n=1 Tax=Tanacetum cinerariifolium TaxID=118510 RepID=A0A699GTV0_TANCI|nr:ribonuclease H-like domain-containing protein [Tanacetum cinerariifolium]